MRRPRPTRIDPHALTHTLCTARLQHPCWVQDFSRYCCASACFTLKPNLTNPESRLHACMHAACWRPRAPAGKIDVNLLDFGRASPLHHALEAGDVALVQLLLDHGADVNQPNPDFRCCCGAEGTADGAHAGPPRCGVMMQCRQRAGRATCTTCTRLKADGRCCGDGGLGRERTLCAASRAQSMACSTPACMRRLPSSCPDLHCCSRLRHALPRHTLSPELPARVAGPRRGPLPTHTVPLIRPACHQPPQCPQLPPAGRHSHHSHTTPPTRPAFHHHPSPRRSALHLACSRGAKPDLLRLLLQRGADVSVAAADGWAPLHLAARAGAAEKVALLLAAGADAAAPNKQVGGWGRRGRG